MAARHLLIPFAGWHAEHDIDSDPNWRVQYGKGIYIEITLPKILFVFILFAAFILVMVVLRMDARCWKPFLTTRS